MAVRAFANYEVTGSKPSCYWMLLWMKSIFKMDFIIIISNSSSIIIIISNSSSIIIISNSSSISIISNSSSISVIICIITLDSRALPSGHGSCQTFDFGGRKLYSGLLLVTVTHGDDLRSP